MALGYGVNAYFNTLVSFIKLYFLMSLINCGLMYVYTRYDGMKSLTGAPKAGITSIGNLGSSSTICSTVNFGVDNNLITCPYGSI